MTEKWQKHRPREITSISGEPFDSKEAEALAKEGWKLISVTYDPGYYSSQAYSFFFEREAL